LYLPVYGIQKHFLYPVILPELPAHHKLVDADDEDSIFQTDCPLISFYISTK
jgi:hypothetical protein